MTDELLQPAATIAAAILAAQINSAAIVNKRATAITPGSIQKIFVSVHQELQAAQAALQAQKPAK